jgi:hypothetical protein
MPWLGKGLEVLRTWKKLSGQKVCSYVSKGNKISPKVWRSKARIRLTLIPNVVNKSGLDHIHPKYLEHYKEIHLDNIILE